MTRSPRKPPTGGRNTARARVAKRDRSRGACLFVAWGLGVGSEEIDFDVAGLVRGAPQARQDREIHEQSNRKRKKKTGRWQVPNDMLLQNEHEADQSQRSTELQTSHSVIEGFKETLGHKM